MPATPSSAPFAGPPGGYFGAPTQTATQPAPPPAAPSRAVARDTEAVPNWLMPAAGAVAAALLAVSLLLTWVTMETDESTVTSTGFGYAASVWAVVLVAASLAGVTAWLQHSRRRQALFGLAYWVAAALGAWRVDAHRDLIDRLDAFTVFGNKVADVSAGPGILLASASTGMLALLGLASAAALILQWSRSSGAQAGRNR